MLLALRSLWEGVPPDAGSDGASLMGHGAIAEVALGELDLGFTNTLLSVDPGAFLLTGQAATFNVSLLAAAGAYTETGVAAILTPTLTAGTGSYLESGQAALFTVTLTAAVRAYLLTGIDAILNQSKTSDAGSYTLTGQNALFNVSLRADMRAYTITGIDADLLALQPATIRRPLFLRGAGGRGSYWKGRSS